MEHGPFAGPELVFFLEDNLNLPVIEEILNDFKGNEDIINALKKYGVTTVDQITPDLLYLEFIEVNQNLHASTFSSRNFLQSMKTLFEQKKH